jgi:SAM-dependent methyltransferase
MSTEGGWSPSYAAGHVADVFDAYGEREWDRHEATFASRISFEIHQRLLAEHVRAGDRVLDAGAGAGRFTVELIRLGATVTVLDLSPGQLELSRQKIHEAGLGHAVEDWVLGDILDLSAFEAEAFDVVVCFGGPLSYVLEGADDALDELLRVTRPGGRVLVGVMSLYGSLRAFLGSVADDARAHGLDAMHRVVATGFLPPSMSSTAALRLYTWTDLRDLLARHGCRVVVASAANFLSAGMEAEAADLAGDADLWEALVEWEAQACRSPGALDGGTHLLAVLEKTTPPR